jgi:predicted dehydrogenase/threonine dehydrogenase-like Zn-dependent dehydrogenase
LKQLLQSLKTGETEIAEVPCPSVRRGQLLIRTSHTLVSVGTERMLVEFGKANWLNKARQQPDKVRMVLDKIKTDGLMPTIETVFNKLDQALPLGYCNVGTVIEVGEGVSSFIVGDRVVSNGKHAEVVSIPVNLCAKVPENVTDENAVFTVLGAIALQGIRLVAPTLGEAIVVTGLGLIGLITVELLLAQGCRVLGIDFDSEKLKRAQELGCEIVDLSKQQDPIQVAEAFSRGRGVDAVIITASTKSNEPVHQAALMCRKRGRIVLVGVTGLELSRADFYEKELSFQVSCSYGPGRYDANYEEKGQDYPIGFVRWTEQRNFEAVLDMMASNRINPQALISHRFSIERAEEAYHLIGGSHPSLGIILSYPASSQSEAQVRQQTLKVVKPQAELSVVSSLVATGISSVSIGFIGSGNYANAVLIPAFKKTGAHLKSIASSNGVSGFIASRKFGFDETTTDTASLFSSKHINALVIATRHNTHAKMVCEGLLKGKHVFVEKPLALSLNELHEIESVLNAKKTHLMVGFNRRFAPHVQKIKQLLVGVTAPKAMVMTVNAGMIPMDHWTQDKLVGGGRILGEVCHFIDLLRFIAGSSIVSWHRFDAVSATEDTLSVTLSFSDGSVGTIHYFANGHKSFPKERLEIFAAGRILQLDNFRKLTGCGWPNFKKMNLWRQDKGQTACAFAFTEAVVNGSPAPIPMDELMEVSRITIEVANAYVSR